MTRQVVRRVDPRGRTLGQILRYHVSEPLGADVHIGLTDQGEVVFCRGQVSVNQLSRAGEGGECGLPAAAPVRGVLPLQPLLPVQAPAQAARQVPPHHRARHGHERYYLARKKINRYLGTLI